VVIRVYAARTSWGVHLMSRMPTVARNRFYVFLDRLSNLQTLPAAPVLCASITWNAYKPANDTYTLR